MRQVAGRHQLAGCQREERSGSTPHLQDDLESLLMATCCKLSLSECAGEGSSNLGEVSIVLMADCVATAPPRLKSVTKCSQTENNLAFATIEFHDIYVFFSLLLMDTISRNLRGGKVWS